MDFVKAAKHFLQELKENKRAQGTLNEYGKDLEMLFNFLVVEGVENVEEVRESHLVSYLDYLIKTRDYQPSSRNRQMNTLRSFFKYCKKAGILPSNPAEHLERLEEHAVERIFITSEEVKALINAIDLPLIKLVVIALFFTGMRINECLSLEERDLDFTEDFIFVRKGKGNKSRKIPLHPELKEALIHYLKDRSGRSDAKELLFQTERTGKLSAVYVNRVIKNAVQKLGWEKRVTCHVFRHSFASALLHEKVNIVAVKDLLGHANLKTTSGYVHIAEQEMSEAIRHLKL